MYTPWISALICGVVAALAMALGVVIQFAGSTTPEPIPGVFIVGASVILALATGIFVSITVRGGLLLARCRQLPARFALVVAAINIALLGSLAAVPVQTHAVMLESPSAQSTAVDVPLSFWLMIVSGLLAPALVGYVAGRVARGAANTA